MVNPIEEAEKQYFRSNPREAFRITGVAYVGVAIIVVAIIVAAYFFQYVVGTSLPDLIIEFLRNLSSNGKPPGPSGFGVNELGFLGRGGF
jgi:hypothetical protein